MAAREALVRSVDARSSHDPRSGRSLPDSFGVVPRLAPTRAHPPPTSPRATTGCTPLLLPRRAVAWWRGGSPTCSGTGWSGGAVGPWRVPGHALDGAVLGILSRHTNKCQGESLPLQVMPRDTLPLGRAAIKTPTPLHTAPAPTELWSCLQKTLLVRAS